MLMRETPVLIDGPVGQLEALYLDHPEPRGLALICHPNPVQGGTMLNKVVSTLQRTARDAGLITLRFNYRGVGASAGTHDMATGEVDDAEAAATWLREKHPDLPMTLLGFSFGGYVAASLGGRLEAKGPQAVYDWSAALNRPHELLKVAECGHFFHGKLTDLKDLVLPRLSN
ncbi:alpha/beta hydrolase [Pseudomonas fluorescens ABAC62]|nr:alpha/beta hydrolase [Pseudomonas fluorescens ABAC62]